VSLVIGIIAAVVVFTVVTRWWADGLVGATEALLLGTIYGGLVFGLFAVRGPGARLLVLLPLLASAAWALYCNKMLGIRQYYRDKIRTYECAIQADPRNTAARSAMAEAYYAIEDLDSAIAAMELAVEMAPNAVKETYKLRQWKEERELRDSLTVVCQVCHSHNLWGETLCRTCRQPLTYPAGTSPVRFEAWKSRAGVLVGGLAWLGFSCLSFTWMKPGQAGIVVGCATLAAAGWVLLTNSRK